MEQGVLESIVFDAGEYVFSDGDVGDCAYFIREGRVEILKESKEDKILIGMIERGGIFGEMALVDAEPRMAATRAKDITTVITIDPEMFTNKLSDSNPFVGGLLRIFCKNIRSTVARRLEH